MTSLAELAQLQRQRERALLEQAQVRAEQMQKELERRKAREESEKQQRQQLIREAERQADVEARRQALDAQMEERIQQVKRNVQKQLEVLLLEPPELSPRPGHTSWLSKGLCLALAVGVLVTGAWTYSSRSALADTDTELGHKQRALFQANRQVEQTRERLATLQQEYAAAKSRDEEVKAMGQLRVKLEKEIAAKSFKQTKHVVNSGDAASHDRGTKPTGAAITLSKRCLDTPFADGCVD